MSDSNVDSLLKKIASSKARADIDESYIELGEVMKHAGRATNNMLLSSIQDECRRNADETSRLNSRLMSIEESMSSLFSEMQRMCSLMEIQNEILSSRIINEQGSTTKPSIKGKEWYYQSTKLSSKNHIYACIIFHLIDMVQIHMDIAGLHYPDSFDCDLNEMQNAIRVVSGERCRIQSVEYKNNIRLKEMSSQPLELLCPLISSSDIKTPTTLSESKLSQLCNQVTRGVMQDIEWIRQRLCHLHGILSIKQIDILKSIRHPIMKVDSDSELDWDRRIVQPKSSHPLSKDIGDLIKTRQDEYMKLRMAGYSVENAYQEAKVYEKPKKK